MRHRVSDISRLGICLVIGGLLIVFGSCASAPLPDVSVSRSLLDQHLSRLVSTDAPREAGMATRRAQYAADQLREAGVQPALWESFFISHSGRRVPGSTADPGASHVIGYLAGRNPNVSSHLVLLTADLDTPGAAAVLEVARVLGADILRGIVPEASVGIALWGPPRTGIAGTTDFLRRPTWSLEGITRVLYVAHDAASAEALREVWESAGIAFEVIYYDDGISTTTRADMRHATYRLAVTAYAAALGAASRDRVLAALEIDLTR